VPEPVIEARGLRKAYEGIEAVRGIDLTVEPGEVFAFLGPNGAGKTTTVEILEGYRERTAGEVSVLGSDPATGERSWRARIGLVLQECRMEPVLTVRETLRLYAGYYSAPRDVDETIALVGLEAKADERAAKLSGGQQRRLDVAVALIGDPELLFLDEPTTGFDPTARRQAWDVIANLRDLGKTVFLTTHYMDEAQRLADRVAIIAHGEIVAEGSPGELGAGGPATTITFRVEPPSMASALPPELAAVPAPGPEGRLRVQTDDVTGALHILTGWALEHGAELAELEAKRPTLEDVYLQLVGETGQ
jgi:ABC-2 type transport system ATP-binding protein